MRMDEEEEADGQRTGNTQTMRQQKCPLASHLTQLSLWRWLSLLPCCGATLADGWSNSPGALPESFRRS